MKCPVCRAVLRPLKVRSLPTTNQITEEMKSPTASVCKRCGADLSPLIHIHDQALWHYQQALQCWKNGDYSQAKAWNEQALALHQNNADFQTLAGRLWALEGEFQQAITSWQKALRLDPQNPVASSYLQILTELYSLRNSEDNELSGSDCRR